MMWQSALLFLASWVLPTVAAMKARNTRDRSDFWLGISAVLGSQALLAAFLHERMAFGPEKYFLIVASSFPLACFFVGKQTIRNRLPARFWIGGLALVGAVIFCENLAVLGSQGWDPLWGNEPYFRPPFNNDGQRHVILVEALQRGTAAPFVPGLTLTYQVLWHHLVAVVAALFPGPSHYPVVQGALLATSLVGNLAILWALSVISPRAFTRKWGWAVVLLALLHADLFHVVRSILANGHWAMEADWSASESFFRYFSLNLVSLTAPQHQLFFLWLAVFIAQTRAEVANKFWGARTIFFFSLCWISSSLMAIFFFPFYFLAQWRRFFERPTQITSAVGGVAIAFVVHWVAIGFSPVKLFTREGNGSPGFFWVPSEAWALVPLTGVATSGALGLAVLLLLAWEVRHWKKARIAGWEWMIFGVGSLTLHYVVTMPEFRRHFAMLATFAAGFWLVDRLPTLYRTLPRRMWLTVGGPVFGIAALLHGYFLYSYLGKPSFIDPKLPWHDYLSLNEQIRRQYPQIPTLAAVDKLRGLDYPPVMEATVSFSAPYHAAVHVQLTPAHQDLMSRMFISKDFVQYGRQLGYQAVVWGPFEALVWGEKVRKRFIDGVEPLLRAGSVALYPIRDAWEEELRRAREKGGLAIFSMAQKLAASGWKGEAIDFYQTVLREDPHRKQAWLELAGLVGNLEQRSWQHEILQNAIKQNPNFPEAFFELGVLMRGMGNPRGAVQAFRQTISLSSKHTAAYRELAATLAWYGNFEEARRVLNRAEKAGNHSESLSSLRKQIEASLQGDRG